MEDLTPLRNVNVKGKKNTAGAVFAGYLV